MAKLNLVVYVCLVVVRPLRLLSLLANITIDRSINRNLYCFVTKMAKLNLVVYVCLVVVRPCI